MDPTDSHLPRDSAWRRRASTTRTSNRRCISRLRTKCWRNFPTSGAKRRRRSSLTNPNMIADRVGDVKVFLPHPEGKETFQPFWPEAEGELRNLVMTKAESIYGSTFARDRSEARGQGAGRDHRLRLFHALHDCGKARGEIAFGRVYRRLPRLGRLVAGCESFRGLPRSIRCRRITFAPKCKHHRIRRAEGIFHAAWICRRRNVRNAARK